MVLKLLATPVAKQDWKFCDQLRDSVRSPPRNIAEGFGRFNPAEFAQFLKVAIASLEEVDNHLRDGVESGLLEIDGSAAAIRLCANCRWMTIRMRIYLRKEAARRKRKRRPKR